MLTIKTLGKAETPTCCAISLCLEQKKQAIKQRFFLRDKNINYCLRCLACQSNGGSCAQRDDMDEILDKMIEADVLVMVTLVYFIVRVHR